MTNKKYRNSKQELGHCEYSSSLNIQFFIIKHKTLQMVVLFIANAVLKYGQSQNWSSVAERSVEIHKNDVLGNSFSLSVYFTTQHK